MSRRWWLLPLTVVTFVVGALSALAATAIHDGNWAWFALAAAAPVAATTALPAGWLRFGFVAGWVSLVFVAVQGTDAGSWAISADVRGYLFLILAVGLLMAAVVTAPVNRSRASATQGTNPTR